MSAERYDAYLAPGRTASRTSMSRIAAAADSRLAVTCCDSYCTAEPASTDTGVKAG